MGRGLLSLGSLLIVATVALWIGGAADWVSQNVADTASSLTLKAGLILVAASLILRILAPMTKQIAKAHCTVCGAVVERGHLYCLDHLQETVHNYRDRTRENTLAQHKRRG
jgi:predicted nucleic acid-binding Zn ribbon protein